MKTRSACMYADNHHNHLSPVLHLSSVVFLINTNYKHAHKHTLVWQHTSHGSEILVLVMRCFHVLQFSHNVVRTDWNSAFMCVPCLHVFFSLMTISSSEEALWCSGHGSSDFPRLECVSEHGEDVCVCVCGCVCVHACLCVSERRGSPELKAPFLMFSLGCGLVKREITNRLTHWLTARTQKHTSTHRKRRRGMLLRSMTPQS